MIITITRCIRCRAAIQAIRWVMRCTTWWRWLWVGRIQSNSMWLIWSDSHFSSTAAATRRSYSHSGRRAHAAVFLARWWSFSLWEFYTKAWNIIERIYSGSHTMHFNIELCQRRAKRTEMSSRITHELCSKFLDFTIWFINFSWSSTYSHTQTFCLIYYPNSSMVGEVVHQNP